MTIENEFGIEDTVYLKHDVEQRPRMVISICVDKHSITYELASGNDVTKHFSFELTKDKSYHL